MFSLVAAILDTKMILSAMADVTKEIPTRKPSRGPPTSLGLLFKLHSWDRPGLMDVQFRDLFAKCQCGLVMTRETFDHHDCADAQGGSTIIDLTDSDEADN
jgi:hypothetical protein